METEIYFCIPESFNTFTPAFDYTITFVNSQLEHKFKGGFVLKNRVKRSF